MPTLLSFHNDPAAYAAAYPARTKARQLHFKRQATKLLEILRAQ